MYGKNLQSASSLKKERKMSVQEEALNKLLRTAMDLNSSAWLPDTQHKRLPLKKSNAISLQFRQVGNTLFEYDDFFEAFFHFTHAIRFAEEQSLELALAFSNRSATFYEKGYFKECLEDIERALMNNYPQDKKEKLIDRKKRALQNLDQQKVKPFHDPLPIIPDPSPCNYSVSKCLQKQKNSEFGRFIVANRDIEPGEILVVEDPYCHEISADSTWLYCSECGELCFSMIPCNGCALAMYCNQECQNKAYSEYHKYECLFLKSTDDLELTYSLFIKTTMKCILERKGKDKKSFSKQYKKIQELLTHKNKADLKEIEQRVDSVHNLLANKTDFLDEINMEDKEKFLKDILLHNYLLCGVNTIDITNYEPQGSVSFGSGIYPYFSMFNHGCTYNVGYSFYGKKIVLRAWRKIFKGDQCFVNYGCLSYKMSKPERQTRLKKKFHFDCKCQACEEDWPTEQNLVFPVGNEFRYFTMMRLRDMSREIRSGRRFTDKERKDMLNRCFKIAEELRSFEPCSEFLLLGYIYDELLLGGNQQILF